MDVTEDEYEGVQAQPRWPWFAAGILLFASAALTAVSVHLHWVPCRGSMLNGTVFATTRTKELSDACLMRMDTGLPFPYPPEIAEQAPWASELGAIGMLLAVLSWIVLVLGLRLRWETRLIALIAAVVPTLVAVMGLSAALNRQRDPDAYISGWLWISVDAGAVVVMIVLWLRNTELRTGTLLGLAIGLWGATAFGMAHAIAEFAAMTSFNENNWDTPPGAGWITVAALVIAGSASFWFGGNRRESRKLASWKSPVADSLMRRCQLRQRSAADPGVDQLNSGATEVRSIPGCEDCLVLTAHCCNLRIEGADRSARATPTSHDVGMVRTGTDVEVKDETSEGIGEQGLHL